jgi:hypothetical protein
MRLLIVCVIAALVAPSLSAECHGKPSPEAQPNVLKISTDAPVFVKSAKNAKLYHVGEAEDMIKVVHLWGSPYEMGFAHGTIVKEDASKFIDDVWAYLELQVEQAINGSIPGSGKLKDWFMKMVADVGLDAALDLTTDATEKYMGDYFNQEMHGMADATGIPFKKIQRIHMIGELTKGACSMYGAWGAALKETNSNMMQLRALDWDVDGPFQNFPQITVYHPTNASDGHAFANIGWTGWIGSITGISSKQMAISEIGVTFPDSTFGHDSRFGVPFTCILRDILQFDNTIDDSINRIANAHRTCSLILGVGDGKLNEFRSVEYSASVANFFDDQNMQPEADWHPRVKDLVYYGMDWLCPNYSVVLHQQLMKHYGNITEALR